MPIGRVRPPTGLVLRAGFSLPCCSPCRASLHGLVSSSEPSKRDAALGSVSTTVAGMSRDASTPDDRSAGGGSVGYALGGQDLPGTRTTGIGALGHHERDVRRDE